MKTASINHRKKEPKHENRDDWRNERKSDVRWKFLVSLWNETLRWPWKLWLASKVLKRWRIWIKNILNASCSIRCGFGLELNCFYEKILFGLRRKLGIIKSFCLALSFLFLVAWICSGDKIDSSFRLWRWKHFSSWSLPKRNGQTCLMISNAELSDSPLCFSSLRIIFSSLTLKTVDQSSRYNQESTFYWNHQSLLACRLSQLASIFSFISSNKVSPEDASDRSGERWIAISGPFTSTSICFNLAILSTPWTSRQVVKCVPGHQKNVKSFKLINRQQWARIEYIYINLHHTRTKNFHFIWPLAYLRWASWASLVHCWV